jgi:hypothetical protein
VRSVVARLGLPEPGTVEVSGRTAAGRPLGLGYQILPARKQPADVSLRQLDHQGGERLGHLLEVVKGEQPVGVPERMKTQSVHDAEALLLPYGEVGLGMCRKRHPPTAFCVHAQRDLLRHRAAWKEERGFLAEDRPNTLLELVYRVRSCGRRW